MKKLVLGLAVLAASSAVYAEKPACKVNVNTAASLEIQSCLNGFGEKKAGALIEARKSGDFKDMADLSARIVGLGEKILERNTDRICFDDACLGKTEAPASAEAAPAVPAQTAADSAPVGM